MGYILKTMNSKAFKILKSDENSQHFRQTSTDKDTKYMSHMKSQRLYVVGLRFFFMPLSLDSKAQNS